MQHLHGAHGQTDWPMIRIMMRCDADDNDCSIISAQSVTIDRLLEILVEKFIKMRAKN